MTSDLSAFSWHTGGTVRPPSPDEPRRVLFRDLGPAALLLLLRGSLPRLAGPTSPVTYARTASYVEPYTDHEGFGRVALMPWGRPAPWHAGIEGVFVTDADARFDPACMEVVPIGADLIRVGAEAASLASVSEVIELLGPRHDDWKDDLAQRLDAFAAELARVERVMAPMRAAYQSDHNDDRQRARDAMAAVGLEETDLCAPWHHLSRERRGFVTDALARMASWP